MSKNAKSSVIKYVNSWEICKNFELHNTHVDGSNRLSKGTRKGV